MKMKAKTYGINFLIAKYLQLKSLSHIFFLILVFVNYIIKWVDDYLITN